MKTCIYTQILLPLFVNHQQRVQSKINQTNFSPPFCQKQRNQGGVINKDVYAIYIHEEEDAKLASLHIYITWKRDDKP